MAAGFGAGGGGVEGVAAVDDGALVADGGVEDAGDEEGAAGIGDGCGADDFGEGAAGDADAVEAGCAGSDGVARGAGVFWGGFVGVRKLLAQAFAEL